MLPFLQKREKSITEVFSPVYRKLTDLRLNTSQQTKGAQNEAYGIKQLNNEYSNVKNALQNLSMVFDTRMSIHERELLAIMKVQIQKMLEDIRRVVSIYNQLIMQQKLNDDENQIKNQVDFFKYQAIRVFKQNKALKNQVRQLRKQVSLDQFQLVCQAAALKSMAKKLQKNKITHNSFSTNQIHISKPKVDHNQAPYLLKTNTLQTQTQSQKFKPQTDDHIKGRTDDSILNTNKSSNFQQHFNQKSSRSKMELKTKQVQNPQKMELLKTSIRNQKNLKMKQKFYLTKNSYKPHRFSQPKNKQVYNKKQQLLRYNLMEATIDK